MNKIKLLILDVDGTLTNGKIYIGNKGELFKAFNVKDGYGISVLQKEGIKVAIVTARQSEIVNNRAKELKIVDVLQGFQNKLEAVEELLKKYSLSYKDVAYMGDDLLDLEVMKKVSFAAAPIDAMEEVKKNAQFISKQKAGEGAVRDLCDFLLKR